MHEPTGLNPVKASRREAFTLALLTGFAILAFLAVSGLAHVYQMQQEEYAKRWSGRGTIALRARQYAAAVTDFRTALRYDRDNFAFQLNLAQALIGMHRADEADAYLVNLLDRQPENGLVNLELARIAAMKGDTDRALRYYHNSIYAIWQNDQENSSRDTRLELIDYLLQRGANGQAQAELIALSANAAENSQEQERLAELFLRAQDSQHALAAFRLELKANEKSHAALAGAGTAAFQLGRYRLAESYLQQALEVAPDDLQSAFLLQKTELVLEMDPYRQQISAAKRAQAAIEAFDVAGNRLNSCKQAASNGTPTNLLDGWSKLKPQINENAFRRNPDLVNKAMDLAGKIETAASLACGAGSKRDEALLLIANLHEEN